MRDIIKDGTDQMIAYPLVDASFNPVITAVEGLITAVEGLSINLIINNGIDVNISTASFYYSDSSARTTKTRIKTRD